jgi:aspartyl-tRNA(Asn)/glutamyl-tRNA(Gln) amidotransferase subunit B
LRDKESAADYRYFPEPDIPPLSFTKEYIESVASEVIKLPSEIKEEYIALGLSEAEAMTLVNEPAIRDRFEAVRTVTKDAKRASSIVLTQMIGFLGKHGKTINDAPQKEALTELATVMMNGTISGNSGKDVLEKMITTGKSAKEIIESEGMAQVSDDSAIEALVKEAIAANPSAIESFKAGKAQALGAIVGAVMKASKGQANPVKVNEVLMKML